MGLRTWASVLVAAQLLPAGCASDDIAGGEVLLTSAVVIDPPDAGLRVGGTQQLTATPYTSSGIPIPNRQVTWQSENPSVATVSEAGLVSAVTLGSAIITATVDEITGTAAVTVSARPAARLSFRTQPQNGTADRTLNAVQVAVQDGLGNTVASATPDITLRLSDNPTGARLEGTTSVRAANGIATFSDLRIDRPGTGFTLLATAGGLSSALSNPFAVEGTEEPPPPVASQLVIAVQPSTSAEEDKEFSQQPVVQLQDGSGRNVRQSGVRVSVTLVGSGNNRLEGDREVETDSDGQARFRDLRITRSGEYRLRFQAGGFSAVESVVIRVRNDG